MTRSPSVISFRATEAVLVLAWLALLAWLLYADALDGFWRSDDGAHLKFAVDHSPWQYFFDPVVTRGQAGAHVTPWNVFFYDLNLALFGFEPRLHYAHLMLLVVAAAGLLHLVMRTWAGPVAAAFGATVFLLGKPVLHVVQQLMCGHYATGLVFSLAALWLWIKALQLQRPVLVLPGALLYLAATACKEVYVPLVVLLAFVPVGSFQQRLRWLWPFAVVAALYVAWRHAVLGQFLGGYSGDIAGWSVANAVTQLAGIPRLLAGEGAPGTIALLVFALFAVHALWRRRVDGLFVLALAAVLLLPLVPLTAHPGIYFADRYLFATWAGVSALVPAMVPRGRSLIVLLFGAVLVGALAVSLQRERAVLMPKLHQNDVIYRFAMTADTASQAVYAPEDDGYWSLVLPAGRHARNTFHHSTPDEPPLIVVDKAPSSFAPVLGKPYALFEYRDGAMRAVDPAAARLAAEERLRKGAGKPLSVTWRYEDRRFLWELGPYPGRYRLTVRGIGTARVPDRGEFPWPRDKVVEMRVCYDADDWSGCSPPLVFDPTKAPVQRWDREVATR